jgi:hypothetical protein
MLNERGREMAHRFPRHFDEDLLKELGLEDESVPAEFLQGVEVWDLISAFGQVIRTLGYAKPREVIYDDTPVEEAAKNLLERIEREKSILFSQLFTKGHNIGHMISMFLAVLELIRQRRIGADQEDDFKDVRLFLRDPSKEEPVKPITPKGAAAARDALQRKGPRRPSAHQLENIRDMMEDIEFEKTEFDEILDSIKVPEVEAFRPIYSDAELMGKEAPPAEGEPADGGTRSVASPPDEATTERGPPMPPATDQTPPPQDETEPPK